MYHLTRLAMESSKVFFSFVSVAQMVRVSRVFIYNMVDVNKIITVI